MEAGFNRDRATQMVDSPTKTEPPKGLPPLEDIKGGPLEAVSVGFLVGIGLVVLA